MIATAPGKLIVTGEYAVLDGALAIVLAVDRRVIARRVAGAEPASPFLAILIDELGDSARGIVVDSAAFYEGPQKLGLGSSAAVTVAAARLALGDAPPAALFELVARVHDRAQGVRGSGADIAAAIHGGVLGFTPGDPLTRSSPAIARLAWPADVQLVPFFTGTSADTAQLVSRVATARVGSPVAVNAALTEIAAASLDVCDALSAAAGDAVIPAFARASAAIDQLAAATMLDLVPSCVRAAREAMSQLGGTAKTTGAGGGDVAIAVIPRSADVTTATRLLIEHGCRPLSLSIDPTGVDSPPRAQ